MALGAALKQIVIKAAEKNNIEPAALLAVVEIESKGKPFEIDNKTPVFLFERHKFYEQLKKIKPDLLDEAVAQGLAIPQWSPGTQYKDMGTSSKKMQVLQRARMIDRECADRACSWGLGQIMGFNAAKIGYLSAGQMVSDFASAYQQVIAMIRWIKLNKLDKALAARNWEAFARGYNGAGFKKNQYDVKLEAAYDKWEAALNPNDPETGEEPVEIPDSVVAEPAPMIKSTIGNGSLVTGGAITTGAGAIVAEKVIDKASDHASNVADQVLDRATATVMSWPTVIALICFTIALGACGFIWWKRYKLKQDAGV